jgi:tetratricopeptide (TPR) repeat protein
VKTTLEHHSHISFVAAALALAFAPGLGMAQQDHDHAHAVPGKLGTVQFTTSCRPEAQAAFTRGLALLHSFAYEQAEKAFSDAASKDASCAMAQWGIAMSHFHPIWEPPSDGEFAAGRAAAQKAATLKAAGGNERDFIAATGAFYRGEGVPYPQRIAAWERAMADVAKRHPQDHEAAIFHALAILGVAYNAPPDKTYAWQKQAAEILNGLLPLLPDHPGIAHYMIHSFDYPELAQLALPAARAYAKIAPAAPHALHMPSHIFTRLGMWQESITSNLASATSAQAVVAKSHPGATAYDALHAWDYLEYAYLQMGRDAQAQAVAEEVARVRSFDVPQFAAAYALAAVPARYALERRAWKDAAALTPRPASFPWGTYPYAEAIVHFARAVGGARSGDLATARQAVAKLEAIRTGLQGKPGFDWSTQVEIQRRAAAGWVARAEGKNDQALSLMKSAADLEDSTDKHPVTPGSVLPAREQYADLLSDLGQPAKALPEYEASLRTAPARLNSYYGAARAAGAANDKEKGRLYHVRLAALCGGKPPARAALKPPPD